MFSKIKRSNDSSGTTSKSGGGGGNVGTSSPSSSKSFSGLSYLPKLPKTSRIPYLSGISSRSKKKYSGNKSSTSSSPATAYDNGILSMPRSLSFSNYKTGGKSDAIAIPGSSSFHTCGSVPSSYHRRDAEAEKSPFFGSLPRLKTSDTYFEPYTTAAGNYQRQSSTTPHYRSETPISSSSLCNEIAAFFHEKNLQNVDDEAEVSSRTSVQTDYGLTDDYRNNRCKPIVLRRSSSNSETTPKLAHRSSSEG
ncbi:unnamed protein product [Enterobius vermicularis]|uniref:Protein BIG GRAIN 1-like A n=1 Tax=Enterobius vermicularis TaxID=51028 RepID=A0A0N4VP48_ENTVE|nr:unnamed protein product [Enterobius vermicularis]